MTIQQLILINKIRPFLITRNKNGNEIIDSPLSKSRFQIRKAVDSVNCNSILNWNWRAQAAYISSFGFPTYCQCPLVVVCTECDFGQCYSAHTQIKVKRRYVDTSQGLGKYVFHFLLLRIKTSLSSAYCNQNTMHVLRIIARRREKKLFSVSSESIYRCDLLLLLFSLLFSFFVWFISA